MPKRKRSSKYEEDLNNLMHKVRKLRRKIRDESDSDSSHSLSAQEDFILTPNNEIETAVPVLQPSDWLLEGLDNEPVEVPHNDQQVLTSTMTNISNSNNDLPQEGVNTSAVDTEEKKTLEEEPATLDTDILQILGDDPSSTVKYGKDIRKEIATRFQHGTTEGITKENRKELISKYPIPANCLYIDAPKLNLEIKAAVPETIAKRDKGIETKQKQMASALSCLGEILTVQLNSKNKDNDLLQKLIDISRILCDIQHADTVTRRNFILFSLKKDLKEHLVNTKVDAFLFGENLAETLKTAKAVNKSGVELKADSNKQVPIKRLKSTVSRPLNRKAGPQARRPQGLAAAEAPFRSREPAVPRARFPPPPPAHSSRLSQAQPPPRRRY